MSEILMFVMAFPFAPLGRLLRWLSLMGGAGNVVAWVLYAGVCLVPLGAGLVVYKRRGRFLAEDGLLVVMGVLLLFVMYYMVNPGAVRGNFAMFPPEVGQMMMGGAVWSVVLAYGVIRLVRRFFEAGERVLFRYARGLLYALAFIFGFAAGHLVVPMVTAVRGGDGFALVRFFHGVMPHVLHIWVVFRAVRLLLAMQDAPYGEAAVLAAQRMSRVCAVVLTVTVLSGAFVNVLQLMLAGRLSDVHINVDFPVTSVVFVLGALLLVRFLVLGKALRDENEGFI